VKCGTFAVYDKRNFAEHLWIECCVYSNVQLLRTMVLLNLCPKFYDQEKRGIFCVNNFVLFTIDVFKLNPIRREYLSMIMPTLLANILCVK